MAGLALVATAALWPTRAPARTEPTPTARGAALGLFATDPQFDYGGMIDEIADRGAQDVLIVERWMQRDIHADAMTRVPALPALRGAVQQARRRGLRVSLMPIVGLRERRAGHWRGVLEPHRGADVWFGDYRQKMLETAQLAEEEGVERLVIGSELNWLEPRVDLFEALVRDVRAVFDGELTYSANWDRYPHVRFWSSLDRISVSAYFPLRGPDGAQLAWTERLAALERFADRRGQGLLLTEVGYPAHAEAALAPWDETRDAPLDQALQASLLNAFCEAHQTKPDVGYFVWNWFGRGGPRDRGYTPRGKPTAAVFERCMSMGEGTR